MLGLSRVTEGLGHGPDGRRQSKVLRTSSIKMFIKRVHDSACLPSSIIFPWKTVTCKDNGQLSIKA